MWRFFAGEREGGRGGGCCAICLSRSFDQFFVWCVLEGGEKEALVHCCRWYLATWHVAVPYVLSPKVGDGLVFAVT